MITAIVQFALPSDLTKDAALEIFQKSVPIYEQAPGLIRKYFLMGEGNIGGGVYLWENREAADRQYSPAWRKMIADKYGAAPDVTYYETPVIVDNTR